MRKYLKNTIDSLQDVFAAWAGGYPEEEADFKTFLSESKLNTLISCADAERLFYHNGFFAKEISLAVYSLIPVKLKTANKEIALFPQTFYRMNLAASNLPNGQLINIGFAQATKVLNEYYPSKKSYIKENMNKLRSANQAALHPETAQRYYLKQKENLSEEKKAERREKSRLRMQKYRAEHPEKAKEVYNKSQKKLSDADKFFALLQARKRNKIYREEHKDELSAKRKSKRLALKQENPLLLQQIDKAHNLSANREKSCHDYYMRNRDKINQKAKENPKTKEYKQRYKAKKRFQTKTGTIILNLLQAIAKSKSL